MNRFTDTDRLMMQRALQLARNGELHASPNPMVGAVIAAPDGRIIGEGWHRRCGEGHAEVNAVASVRADDRKLLPQSTIYVTLEPCSHYGKTPPCARLIIESGIRKVVVATEDPFAKVAGRGIAMLREAGIEVRVGLLENEARRLNKKFITAHTLRRPYITLKWAQSADGYIDGRITPSTLPAKISDSLGQSACHLLRATHDAIIVGSGTYLADSPSLTVRHYAGESPRRLIADRSGRIREAPGFDIRREASLQRLVTELYNEGVTSLLVEGGKELLEAFINSRLFDDIHIETNKNLFLGNRPNKTEAPKIAFQ